MSSTPIEWYSWVSFLSLVMMSFVMLKDNGVFNIAAYQLPVRQTSYLRVQKKLSFLLAILGPSCSTLIITKLESTFAKRLADIPQMTTSRPARRAGTGRPRSARPKTRNLIRWTGE